jgi:hypothetical protein
VGAALAAGAVAIGLGAPAARADTPVRQGWWTTVPVAPDVPSDGLLVQGGATGPTAYAALVYPLAGSATSATLSLATASGGASTPGAALQVCALSAPDFNAVQGGPMADAPAYVSGNCVPVALDSTGKAYRADVTKLLGASALAVALLPSSAGGRVVLARPDAGSLQVTTTAGAEGDASPSPDAFAEPAPTGLDGSSMALPDSSLSLPSAATTATTAGSAPAISATDGAARAAAVVTAGEAARPGALNVYGALAFGVLCVGAAGVVVRRRGVSWIG